MSAAIRRELRVLHVTACLAPRVGGPSKVAVEMCQALARKGVAVTLFTTNLDEWPGWLPFRPVRTLDVPTDRSLVVGGVEVRYFRAAWPWRLYFSPMMGRELRRRVPDFDVVHVHSLYLFPTLVATLFARRVGRPYIVRPHGSLDPYLRRRHRFRKALYNSIIERRNLDGAAAIHYTTADEMELARPVGIKAPGAVVPLGIDLAEFANLPPRGTFRRDHPELANRRLIVFLGRLTPKKGLDLLVQAFAVVAKECPDSWLVIAGPDDEGYGRNVRSWLKEAGVDDRTTFLGMVQGLDKLALLADTDVWVLPSYTENFGVAVVEAMACGLPVVISDRVNIHGEVAQAKAGLVVPCNVKAIADAIRSVLDDASLRVQLSGSARGLVHSQFTWESAAGKLIELYDAICTSQPRRERQEDRPAEVAR